MNITGAITKIIGASSLALIGYDSIERSTRTSKSATNNDIAEFSTNIMLSHSQSMENSTLLEKLKSRFRESILYSKDYANAVGAKNTASSLISEFGQNIFNIGFSAGALAGGKFIGSICAGVLVFKGIKTFLGDVAGIKKPSNSI